MLVELSDLWIPEQTVENEGVENEGVENEGVENEGVDFACLSRRSFRGQLNYCDSFPIQLRNLEEST